MASLSWGGLHIGLCRNVGFSYRTQIGLRRDVKFRCRSVNLIVNAKKNVDAIAFEEPEEEIMLDNSDLMQLKFSILLGESRELSIAKVVAKKINPHLNNLEIHHLVKKKGADVFLRLISDRAKQAAAETVDSPAAPTREKSQENMKIEEDTAVSLAPKPNHTSQGKSNNEDEDTGLTSLSTAANSQWMNEPDISIERFVKLLEEEGDIDYDVAKRGGEEISQREGFGIKPARKFDRRPRKSDKIGRRTRSKQIRFTGSASKNKKLTKSKGK